MEVEAVDTDGEVEHQEEAEKLSILMEVGLQGFGARDMTREGL